MPPLPDTADEARSVFRSLGGNEKDLILGRDATEAEVKTADLENYRVLYFATHGLLAGELEGLGKVNAEPALVMSVPDKPTEEDDGLLTASEAAQLKLNADWVVLSACETAAGNKPGAEALSGLARAFFYAGARSLLVSHWKVESAATTRLMTSLFENLADMPGQVSHLTTRSLVKAGDVQPSPVMPEMPSLSTGPGASTTEPAENTSPVAGTSWFGLRSRSRTALYTNT